MKDGRKGRWRKEGRKEGRWGKEGIKEGGRGYAGRKEGKVKEGRHLALFRFFQLAVFLFRFLVPCPPNEMMLPPL